MAIIMGKGCIEAIYGLMGWKGFTYGVATIIILLSKIMFMWEFLFIHLSS